MVTLRSFITKLHFPLFSCIGIIKGLHNIPKNIPFLLASNHPSRLDPCLLYLLLYKYANIEIHFLTTEELYHKLLLKKYLEFFNAIKIEESDRAKSVEQAIKVLHKCGVVGIFPEGQRSNLNNPRIKTGVARIALQAEVPIVPVRLLDKKSIFFKRFDVVIGKPLRLNKYYMKKKDPKVWRSIAEKSYKVIMSLS